jgi:thiosulfate dehydrogenase [quinone] large subunit
MSKLEEFQWNKEFRKQHKVRTASVVSLLTLRYLFGLMFTYAFFFKLSHKWMWTSVLQQHFKKRLDELDPKSFQAFYLRRFAIPMYMPIAWFVTIGQAFIMASMFLGVAVRSNAVLSLFMFINFIAGGFSNKTLPPFIACSILLMSFPTSEWLGMDKKLHEKFPDSFWFK